MQVRASSLLVCLVAIAAVTAVPVGAAGGSTDAQPSGPTGLPVSTAAVAGTTPATWNATVAGPGDQAALDVARTDDGGYVVAGTTERGDTSHAMLAKLDADGRVVWNRTYPSDLARAAWGVVPVDGGFVFVGHRDGADDLFDAAIVKVDGGGDVVWQQTMDAGEFGFATDVVRGVDGGVVLAGNSGGSPGDGLVARVGPDGSVAWQRTLGGDGVDRFNSITRWNGGYVAGGITRSGATGRMDAWAVSLGADGTTRWERRYDGQGFDGATDVAADADGLVVAGTTATDQDAPGDAWLLRLAGDGSVTSEHTYGGSAKEAASAVVATDDGFLLAGLSATSGGVVRPFLLAATADGTEQSREILGAGSAYDLREGRFVGAGPVVGPTADGGVVLAWPRSSGGDADVRILVHDGDVAAGGGDTGLLVTVERGVTREGAPVNVTVLPRSEGQLSDVAVTVSVDGRRVGSDSGPGSDGQFVTELPRRELPAGEHDLSIRAVATVDGERHTGFVNTSTYVGATTLVVGSHTVASESGENETLRIVVPAAYSRDFGPRGKLDALANASGLLRVGARSPAVNVFATAKMRGGGVTHRAGRRDERDVRIGSTSLDTILHEYVHTRQDHHLGERMAWFTEGSADYYGARLRYQLRGGSSRDVARSLSAGRYSDVVLADEGTWGTQGDYHKGALVLAALDAKIQDESGGDRSLQFVFARINAHDGEVSLADFRRFASEAAGTSLDDWIDRYVTTSEAPEPPLEARYYEARDFDADADGDGLADIDEARLGADPSKPDTDGDGVGDAEDAYPADASLTTATPTPEPTPTASPGGTDDGSGGTDDGSGSGTDGGTDGPNDTPGDERGPTNDRPSGDTVPGFGTVTTVVALFAAALATLRRRHSRP